ncbi:MAG: hypothetical protein GX604_05225 [Actinobacteria bacterium]|nr:hypothetical protein [Actinomycetota bacterium]
MFKLFRSPYRRVSLILMVLAAASAAGAVLVGVDDNPPGLALAVLAGTMLVTAFVHHWQSMKRFFVLSVIAFGLSAIMVGILIAIDVSLTGGHVAEPIATAVDLGSSALALILAFLIVPSILVGLAGALVMLLVARQK